MNTKEIKKFFVKNKKPILIAVGVIVAVVVVWIVWKRIKNGLQNQADKEQAEENTGQSVTTSINWRDLAVRLRKAFGGPNSSGTDENEIYLVLGTLRNQADWEYLKRYWTSYCDSLPWWQSLNDVLMNGTNYKSLTASLIYELDSSELQTCRNILEQKGITPDF